MEGELLRPFISFEQVFPNSGHCVNIFSHRFVPWPINVPENRENARGVRFDLSKKFSESKTRPLSRFRSATFLLWSIASAKQLLEYFALMENAPFARSLY